MVRRVALVVALLLGLLSAQLLGVRGVSASTGSCGIADNCALQVTDAIGGARAPWVVADTNAIAYNDGPVGCPANSSCVPLRPGYTSMGSGAEQSITADVSGRMVLQGSHAGGSGSITLQDRSAGTSTSLALASSSDPVAFDSTGSSACATAGDTLTLQIFPESNVLQHTISDFAISLDHVRVVADASCSASATATAAPSSTPSNASGPYNCGLSPLSIPNCNRYTGDGWVAYDGCGSVAAGAAYGGGVINDGSNGANFCAHLDFAIPPGAGFIVGRAGITASDNEMAIRCDGVTGAAITAVSVTTTFRFHVPAGTNYCRVVYNLSPGVYGSVTSIEWVADTDATATVIAQATATQAAADTATAGPGASATAAPLATAVASATAAAAATATAAPPATAAAQATATQAAADTATAAPGATSTAQTAATATAQASATIGASWTATDTPTPMTSPVASGTPDPLCWDCTPSAPGSPSPTPAVSASASPSRTPWPYSSSSPTPTASGTPGPSSGPCGVTCECLHAGAALIAASIDDLRVSVDALAHPVSSSGNPLSGALEAVFVPRDAPGDIAPASIQLEHTVPALGSLLPGLATIPASSCQPIDWAVPGFFGKAGFTYRLDVCNLPFRLFVRSMLLVSLIVYTVIGLIALVRDAFTDAN